MIISQEELNGLTQKKYGSKTAIDRWSNDVDQLLEDFESLRAIKRKQDELNQAWQSAKRILI